MFFATSHNRFPSRIIQQAPTIYSIYCWTHTATHEKIEAHDHSLVHVNTVRRLHSGHTSDNMAHQEHHRNEQGSGVEVAQTPYTEDIVARRPPLGIPERMIPPAGTFDDLWQGLAFRKCVTLFNMMLADKPVTSTKLKFSMNQLCEEDAKSLIRCMSRCSMAQFNTYIKIFCIHRNNAGISLLRCHHRVGSSATKWWVWHFQSRVSGCFNTILVSIRRATRAQDRHKNTAVVSSRAQTVLSHAKFFKLRTHIQNLPMELRLDIRDCLLQIVFGPRKLYPQFESSIFTYSQP